MALKVLSALDTAKTQWYHFKAIIIAGMGLFTDAYDLFCIPLIIRLLGRIYYDHHPKTFKSDDTNFFVPALVVSALVGFPLLGTILGQLLFGRLGDLVGRRHVYGLSLMVMVLSSIGCGFSICTSRTCVLVSLGFFRFLLGVGIGGDYPLSATIMSEFANKRTRGSFIAAVFSMQGFGILAGCIVTIVVCAIFNIMSNNPDPKEATPDEADIAWRLILMLGAIPAAMTYYWRMMMPETARYTALVELNVAQAAKDMEKVLAVSLSQIVEDEPEDLQSMGQNPASSYPFFSIEFLRLHGRDLFSCAANWLLVDIVFYSSNLFQSEIYKRYIDQKHPKYDVNLYQDALHVAELQAIITICSTIPGYWFTVYFIDRIGRRKLQMMGFFVMALVYFSIGIPYKTHWANHIDKGFMVLYGLTFFFANFGPNTTTFIVPAELFPARFRSTCHGISGASGKVGALIGSLGFLWAAHGENDEPRRTRIKWSLIGLGVVCILGLVVTYLYTPETKGTSLEENENENENENGNEQRA